MRIPLILSFLFCFAAQGSETVLEKVAANFSGIETVRADFVQIRELKALETKLVMKGSFALERHRRMLWRVDSPLFSVCVISDEALLQWDAESGKIMKLSASQLPWLKLLFANLSGWMTADPEVLQKEFSVTSAGESRIALVPKAEGFRNYVSRIEIEFDESFSVIRQVLIEEAGGDTVTIDFAETVKNQPISEDTWILPPRF